MPDDQRGIINDSSSEFLIDPYYTGPILTNSKSSSIDLLGILGNMNTTTSQLPTRLSRLNNPLNLYDIVESYKNSSRSGKVDTTISWDMMGQVSIDSF